MGYRNKLAEKDLKKCLTFLALREMQTKTNLRSYTSQNGKAKMNDSSWRRRTFTHCWECKLVLPL